MTFSLNANANVIFFKLIIVSFVFSVIQVVTNCQNTVQGFKRFHGRAFTDPYVQSAKSNVVYNLAQMSSGATGIKVKKKHDYVLADKGLLVKGLTHNC